MVRTKTKHDYFSNGIVVYSGCFFLSYKTLLQLSYVERLSEFWYWGFGLIIFHILALFWCVIVCIYFLMPRQLASFVCATSLVAGLEYISPDPLKVHFWLHKTEYLARVSATLPSHDDRLSIVLYSHTVYFPAIPGGHLCSTEIVYDNSNNIGLIARTEDGRASVTRIEDDFYFRYPPCG
jgi:hypothetical protein